MPIIRWAQWRSHSSAWACRFEEWVARRPSSGGLDPAVLRALNRVVLPRPASSGWSPAAVGVCAAALAAALAVLGAFWHWELPTVTLFALATILVAWGSGMAAGAVCGLISVLLLGVQDGGRAVLAYGLTALPVAGLVILLRRAGTGTERHLRALTVAVEEQRQLEVRVAEANKMEALGRLAGGVAHDFNNSLAVILSMGELVLQDPSLRGQAAEDVGEITAAARRATELTRQLLNFARQENTAPEPVNVGRFATMLLPVLRRLLPGSVTLTLTSATAGTVLIDPGYMEQLLVNLLINARDAVEHQGAITVTITTRQVEAPPGDGSPADAPVYLAPGPYSHISVTDTGCGMDVTTLRHIFEPFFTTKPKGRGTGLGLSTVYTLVQRCGGDIQVTSQLGHGTTFDLFLPETAMPETATPAQSLHHTPRTGRILLAEDDEALRRLLVRMLAGYGYEVIEWGNGRAALDWLDGAESALQALVTDVVMPFVGGRELAQAARNRYPALPVIYMSGWTQDELAAEDLTGEVFFLQKPFRPDALLDALARVIGP